MKKNTIQKVMATHPNLGEFVNGEDFLKEVHSLYKNIGGMKNYVIAKGIVRYVTNENELDWEYVVKFLAYLFEDIDKKGITACKENIDWKTACEKCYPKELDKVKTKVAFKDLFYLVALNNGEDADAMLAESALSAYGWSNIVKRMVALYEEMLSTNTEYAEHNPIKVSLDIADDNTEIDAPRIEAKAAEAEPKMTITATDVVNPAKATKEHAAPTSKKYARGRTIVLKCLDDDTEKEWASPKDISDSIGISEGAIRKNVSGHSEIIKFNNKKYQASYKEVC